jgi:hypothetical protein
MRSILQVALLVAAVAGVGLAIRRRSFDGRWWVCALLGLVGFAMDGFVVPLGGLFLLVVVLSQPGVVAPSSTHGGVVSQRD